MQKHWIRKLSSQWHFKLYIHLHVHVPTNCWTSDNKQSNLGLAKVLTHCIIDKFILPWYSWLIKLCWLSPPPPRPPCTYNCTHFTKHSRGLTLPAILRNVSCMLCVTSWIITCNIDVYSINCNHIYTLWFSTNQQLLDKINTDTEMDDIIQDYNAVSYVVAVFLLVFVNFCYYLTYF